MESKKEHKGSNDLPPITISGWADKKLGRLVDSKKWVPGEKERDATSDLAVSPSAE